MKEVGDWGNLLGVNIGDLIVWFLEIFLNDSGLPILLVAVEGLDPTPRVGRYSNGEVVVLMLTLELFLLLFLELNFLKSLKLFGLCKDDVLLSFD